MRIIYQDTESYLQSLATTVGKDPASLESWRCIHVYAKNQDTSPLQPVSWPLVLDKLQDEFKDISCDIVLCADHELLIIGQSVEIEDLHKLKDQLFFWLGDADAHFGWQLYDLFYGWREVRRILLSKLQQETPAKQYDDKADFGEVHAMTEIFNAAKKRQPVRQPLHILLVEDDEMTQRLVSSLFKHTYAVFTASSAQEALVQYMVHAPDIVFLDINLPDHNGFQVLQKILTHDPDAYVVMFSGNSYLDNITHALEAGAVGFVAKPFSQEKMRHYIEDCELARQGK